VRIGKEFRGKGINVALAPVGLLDPLIRRRDVLRWSRSQAAHWVDRQLALTCIAPFADP
jgi:hypothetical protein